MPMPSSASYYSSSFSSFSSLPTFVPLLFLLFLFAVPPSSVVSLKCYQTQLAMNTAPASTDAKACPSNSVSCIKSTDLTNQIVMRNCQSIGCMYQNGTASAQDLCYTINMSSSSQQYCCCTQDSCNRAGGVGGQMAFLVAMMLLVLIGTLARGIQ